MHACAIAAKGDHMRRLLLLCALLSCGLKPAVADDYPSHPIRLVVPFSPGGAVDSLARVIATPLGGQLGQPVVVYNRGGAGGEIGMDEVAKAPPDGYTLLLDHSGLTYMPGIYRNLPFDPVKDFEGIIVAVTGIYILAVNNDLPVHSVADLIAYAKANPGKLSYGSAGVGSSLHLAGEFFKHDAGIDIVHVPYKGPAEAAADMIGGRIQMMFGPSVTILPLAADGKIRALAVTAAKRSSLAPDLPTMAETLPGFEVTGWYGLAAPAGTPRPIIDKLNRMTSFVLQELGPGALLHKLGYEPVGSSPEQASARIKSDVAKWTRIIHDAGIEPQ
jgi:tripartite-type tricarboxylate transporter receptor subunit TctC